MSNRYITGASEIVDVHTHFGNMPCVNFARGLAEFEDVERSFGITRAICTAARAIFYDMTSGNAEMYDAVESSGILYMYVYVNPLKLDASLKELDTYAGLPRVAGIKSRPSYHHVPADGAPYLELCARAAELGMPYLMHAREPADVLEGVRLIEKVPSLSLILAHVAPTDWPSCVDALRDHPNIHLDLCASIQQLGRIRHLLDLVGAQRILLGTNSTLLSPAWMLGAFQSAEITPAEKELIYRENALRLFGDRLR